MTRAIGWIGLGQMGQGMAVRLQQHLAQVNPGAPPLLVFNRTASKAEPVVAVGAQVAESVVEVVQKSSIVITSLANDAAVAAIYAEMLAAAPSDRSVTFIETSTVYPDLTKSLSEAVTGSGHVFLSAPVFGPPAAAVAGTLVLVLAGPKEEVDAAETLLVPAIARKTIRVGEDPAAGSKLKLVGNSFVIGAIELVAEGMTLGEKSGVGQEAVLEFIHAMMPIPTMMLYGGRQVTEEFVKESSFPVTLSLKDAGHITALAKEYGAAVPVMAAAKEHLEYVRDQGHADWDHSGMVGALRAKAGLPMELKKRAP